MWSYWIIFIVIMHIITRVLSRNELFFFGGGGKGGKCEGRPG